MADLKNAQLLSSFFDKHDSTEIEIQIKGIYNFSPLDFEEYQMDITNVEFDILDGEQSHTFPLKLLTQPQEPPETDSFFNFLFDAPLKIVRKFEGEDFINLKNRLILDKEIATEVVIRKRYNFSEDKITKKQKGLENKIFSIKIPLNELKGNLRLEKSLKMEQEEENKENLKSKLTKKMTMKKEYKTENYESPKMMLRVEMVSKQSLFSQQDPMSVCEIIEKSKFEKSADIKLIIKNLICTLKNSMDFFIHDYVKTVGSSGTNFEDLKKFNASTEQQQLKLINSKKMAYLKEFFESAKHKKFLKKFLHVVENLFYDSLSKNFVLIQQEEIQKNITILNLQVKKICEFTIQKYYEKFEAIIPIELKYFNNFNKKEQKGLREFFQETEEMFFAKVKEYEKVGNFYLTEKFLKEKVLKNEQDKDSWFNLAIFYLRRQNFRLAEGCLNKMENLNSSISLRRLKACFYFNRNRIKEANKIILKNLEEDKWSILDNLLMAIIQDLFFGKTLLSKKYYNVAKKSHLTTFYKTSTKMKDLSMIDVDQEVWKILINYLTKNCFVSLVKMLLPKIQTDLFYKHFILGNIESIQNNYSESNNYLEFLIKNEKTDLNEMNPFHLEAIATKACNCFFLDHHYEAETNFLVYLKKISTMKKTSSEQFYNILLILANSYLKRGSFSEAASVFKKLETLNPKSMIVWLGIAKTSLHFEDLEEAEEALANASKINPQSSEVWAYFILLNFKKFENGFIQFDYLLNLFNIYFDQEIENLELLQKIRKKCSQNSWRELEKKCVEKLRDSWPLFQNLTVNKNLNLEELKL